jgi:hypothetical protein
MIFFLSKLKRCLYSASMKIKKLGSPRGPCQGSIYRDNERPGSQTLFGYAIAGS